MTSNGSLCMFASKLGCNCLEGQPNFIYALMNMIWDAKQQQGHPTLQTLQ